MKGLRLLGVLVFLFVRPGDGYARGPWVTLENGHYLYKRANDGDSFHVSVNGKEYIFRLYFVDAPETDEEFPQRVKEQADYFGITPQQAVQVGEVAKVFTREKLTAPFEVRTCWEDAMGRSRLQRFYAIIQTTTGDLAEQLVENGLARLHGFQADPAGLTSARQEWQKLNQMLLKAKREQVGAWGVNVGRMNTRTADPMARGADPFEAFFHPAQPAAAVATAAPAVAQPRAEKKPLTSAKLDVNAASAAELENIPGIGPALSARIIAARPFQSADDLQRVKGIGSGAKYEKIRPYFQ